MPNPQIENGYTKIANELMEALANYRIPGEQMQCLFVILRKTYGFNKKSDNIALSQFVKATGLKKQNVYRSLKALENKNIIVIKTDYKIGAIYRFNKIYTSWNVSSKLITSSKAITAVIKTDYKSNQKRLPQKKKETITKESKNHSLPKDYKLEDRHKEYFKTKNSPGNIDDVFEGFCIYHKKNGNKYVDWYSAWQNWVRTHIKFNKKECSEDIPDGLFKQITTRLEP